MPDDRKFLKFKVLSTIATTSKDRVVFPVAGEVIAVSAAVGTAPVTSALIADVSDATTSIYSRGAVTGVAATDTLSVPTAHGLVVGDIVLLGAVTTMVGLTAVTPYYVITVPTTKSLTVSATLAGTVIDITTGGTALALYKASDLPTIAAAAYNSNAAAVAGVVPQPVAPVNPKFAAGDTLFLSVLQIGSGGAGSDLDVTVEYITV
jgi:hypothetical protein